MGLVFKIMGEAEYAVSRAGGFVVPAVIDRADGYIHLSAEDQVLETARLHFAGRGDLVAVGFDADELGLRLKWEVSRGGAPFPHYYGALSMGQAVKAVRLVRLPDGAFAVGEAVA